MSSFSEASGEMGSHLSNPVSCETPESYTGSLLGSEKLFRLVASQDDDDTPIKKIPRPKYLGLNTITKKWNMCKDAQLGFSAEMISGTIPSNVISQGCTATNLNYDFYYLLQEHMVSCVKESVRTLVEDSGIEHLGRFYLDVEDIKIQTNGIVGDRNHNPSSLHNHWRAIDIAQMSFKVTSVDKYMNVKKQNWTMNPGIGSRAVEDINLRECNQGSCLKKYFESYPIVRESRPQTADKQYEEAKRHHQFYRSIQSCWQRKILEEMGPKCIKIRKRVGHFYDKTEGRVRLTSSEHDNHLHLSAPYCDRKRWQLGAVRR